MAAKRQIAELLGVGLTDLLANNRRFCFVDDDETNRSNWLAWAEKKGKSAAAFESAYEANQWPADVYVFDLSALSPMCVGHHAYSPICRLAEDHPGSEIVIASCLGIEYVQEVIDDVEEITGRRVFFSDLPSSQI